MAGLMDLLLSAPSAQDRYAQAMQMMQSSPSGPSDPRGLGDLAPPGRGIFGNEDVDVLLENDPRLRNVLGLTLARPAAKSLVQIARELGLTGQDFGGGYRTPSEQAGMNPATAAPVGQSYHQEGLAIDLAAALQIPRVERALAAAGWNRFSPSGEPWHWSYGVTG